MKMTRPSLLVCFVTLLMFSLQNVAAANTDAYDSWFAYISQPVIEAGAKASEIDAAFRRIEAIDPYKTGPGSWVYELNMPGDVHHRAAQALEVGGKTTEALAEYRIADAYFNAARWPCLSTPERASAFQKHLDCFLKIASYTGMTPEIIRIPFEGKEIVTHLHLPENDNPPVIIWSGGMDGWKAGAGTLKLKAEMMSEGFAILAVDLPGTGESQHTLKPTSDRVYSRIVDYLKEREDVDGSNVGVYFGSFSGMYAIKLALIDPDIGASVNHSGGIHIFFTRKFPALPPLTMSLGMRAFATINAMGLSGAPLDEILTTFSAFSLKHQGLLEPHPNQAPLLSIYGDQDDLMPIEDLEVLIQSGVKTEALVYEGDGHMAWEHEDDHQPKMLEFFKKHLVSGGK